MITITRRNVLKVFFGTIIGFIFNPIYSREKNIDCAENIVAYMTEDGKLFKTFISFDKTGIVIKSQHQDFELCLSDIEVSNLIERIKKILQSRGFMYNVGWYIKNPHQSEYVIIPN